MLGGIEEGFKKYLRTKQNNNIFHYSEAITLVYDNRYLVAAQQLSINSSFPLFYCVRNNFLRYYMYKNR